MTKIKPLKQKDSLGCGPTCIKMVANYFQINLKYNYINKISKYLKEGGMSNKSLIKTMGKIGLCVKEKKSAFWNDLRKKNIHNQVIIVSWMLNGYIGHFSVVDRVTPKYIFLAEPSCGRIVRFKRIHFLRLWFDYDEIWYPQKVSDIQLRWMVVIAFPKTSERIHN